jgi:hypothetical protein
VANAAIVPAGYSYVAEDGSIDVYASAATQLIIDVNGYFLNGSGGTMPSPMFLRGSNLTTLIEAVNHYTAGVANPPSVNTSGLHGVVDVATTDAEGVFGEAYNGATYGVKGQQNGSANNGAGVLGVSSSRSDSYSSTFPWFPAGVRGESQTGHGLLGITDSATGKGATGVSWNATSHNARSEGFLGYGVYGVYSLGDMGGTGAKYFVDPHPTDATKVIRYVAMEGPEAVTFFRGRGHFSGGRAVIEVPESFRLVTEDEGLTVNITPMGRIASFAVTDVNLAHITVEATRDVEFSYMVYGVRKGYADYQPIVDGNEFTPSSADARMPEALNANQRKHLVENGTYNIDGSVNINTAIKLGWAKVWATQAQVGKPIVAAPAGK